ncbi:MAG: CotH kinase family protein [Muribaculaceae bacterium]|nr:CotH kinase family protein [Muribaculaceae bacterium]
MALCVLAQQNPPDNRYVQLTSTNLPIVFLNVDGRHIDRYERITARMKIIDNGPGQPNYADTVAHPGQHIDYEGYIALRYRGNTSYSGSPKKPYSFRTLDAPLEEGGEKQKVRILGMGKDNNWALIAPFADKSMMRDALAFELARPWMDFAPNTRFCEMLLDGTYYGVFVMTEVVSKGKHRLNLDDPGNEGDELTGGYILEVDRTDEAYYTSKYHPVNNRGRSYNNQYVHIQYKSPEYDEMTPEQIAYIQSAFDAMEATFASSNYKDPVKGYASKIDVTSFIDYQLAEEFAHNVDGYRLSTKFFKRRDSEDPRFKMVLWDLNLAYGNSDYYQGWRTDTWFYQSNDIMNNAGDTQLVPFWWYKLNSDEAYTAALKQRWAQYRRANFRADRLMATIDSMAHVLTDGCAEARNSQAWPYWGRYVWPNKYVAVDFDDEIDHLKQWVTDRLAWMDSQLDFDPNALLPGDVNADGVVDIEDVNIIINIILGKASAADYEGDPNADGEGDIDIGDVNAAINAILNAS